MRTGHETGNVQEFNGDGAPAVDARAVVGFAAGLEGEACTGAGDLEEADCALRVYGGEAVGGRPGQRDLQG